MHPQRFGARAEYREQERQRVKDSLPLAEAFKKLKSLTVEFEHYDPEGTKAHKGPGGGGHKGDLPKLEVNPKGNANVKLNVPGLKLADLRGRALMIHEGGDNYSDTPKPLGGGGARIACGVVPSAPTQAKKKASSVSAGVRRPPYGPPQAP